MAASTSASGSQPFAWLGLGLGVGLGVGVGVGVGLGLGLGSSRGEGDQVVLELLPADGGGEVAGEDPRAASGGDELRVVAHHDLLAVHLHSL